MHYAHRRRLIIAIVGGCIILLVLMAIGVYGLLRGPEPTSREDRPVPNVSVSVTPQSRVGQPTPVVETSDPKVFARNVARALFTWDTRDEAGVSDWAQVLVDVADADEAAAVASDVRSYLPGDEMWKQLRSYGTRQRLDVESVAVPTEWKAAQVQAAAEQIPQGAAAFTVEGTRHREGTWAHEVVRSDRKVSFTIFAICPDETPCTLLRLSQLDKPLK